MIESSEQLNVVRILVGVDRHHADALEFLERLRFASAKVSLLHVVESLLPDGSFPSLGPSHPLSAMMAEQEAQGKIELAAAAAKLDSAGYPIETEMAKGDPARCLIERGSQLSADLIAVGSSQKGYWGSLFFGSVTKALTAGAEPSILVAKSPPHSESGLAAVFATDHSPYADACAEKLLKWQACGIERITLLTSLGRANASFEPARQAAFADVMLEVRDRLHTKGAELCQKFRSSGIECEAVLTEDIPQNAITRSMMETKADLLILGARGHGLWDRFRLGSVSHFQVVATPHNVLVIRV